MTASHAPAPAGWADLPLDLLVNVSALLCDAADFVRLHAVCKPWRDMAALPPAAATIRPAFLLTRPWILAPCDGTILHYPYVNLWRVSPEATTPRLSCHRRYYKDVLPDPPGTSSTRASDRNWVASADGKAVWLFTGGPEPKLTDLLTGDATLVPPFPDDDDELKRPPEKSRGIFYGDGTIFLYSFSPRYYYGRGQLFTAAILHPGDTAWTVVKKNLGVWGIYSFGATYHRDAGKLLLWIGGYGNLLTLNPGANNRISGEDMLGRMMQDTVQIEGRMYICDYSYSMVSHGELLLTSVLVERELYHCYVHEDPPPRAISLTVYALERVGGDQMRWVEKDVRRLKDRVMFLGAPASFTVDVAQQGVSGGYAYFVFKCGVYSYNLLDGEAKLVAERERLHLHWGADEVFMWLQPQPTIAPIQEIRGRLLKASSEKQDVLL